MPGTSLYSAQSSGTASAPAIIPDRKRFAGLTILELICLGVFAALVLITEAHHEPFADEAQSWLLARDLGFWPMISNALRYEGSPGLWPAILWVASHAGLPYSSAGYIACAFGIASAYFLLRYSPFPLVFRLALPFTYWICYQYTIIARSYAITTLALFITAHLFRKRPKGIIALAVALAAMANANAPGLAMACGFAAAYGWLIWRERKLRLWELPLRSRALAAAVIFVIAAGISVWVARPAPDQNFNPTRLSTVLTWLHMARPAVATHDFFFTGSPPPPRGFAARALKEQAEFGNPISPVPLLSYALVAMVIWQLWRRRLMVLLLPLSALYLFLLLVFAVDWHFGLIPVTLIALLWISWPASFPNQFRFSRAELIPAAPLAIMCAIQLAWTIHAVGFDLKYPYSGAAACADYLKKEASGRTIFGYGYLTVAVSAYFDEFRFANQPDHAYWLWSYRNRINFNLDRLDRESPDLVLLTGSVDLSSPQESRGEYLLRALQLVEAHGYMPVKSFAGYLVMRGGFKEKDNYYVLKRVRKSPSSPNQSVASS